MKRKNHGKFLKILSLLLLITWCSLIFFFSSQSGNLSSDSSNFVILTINNFLRLFNSQIDILSIPYMTLIIRKMAHMFLYFGLYFFTYFAMFQFNFQHRKYLALIFCFGYAISDEFHQLFVINRSGQVMDVLIDTFGSFLAFIWLQLVSLRKNLNHNTVICEKSR